ncbi:C-factor [Cyprinodon tularosa]|uniref:C-factor n=1 Tax=Cyprinodon tularosa TaxID=77115 RepID=UPI0018E27897|nr:C-factor [Cyprinodon tularosa]
MSRAMWSSVLITGCSRGIGLRLVRELAHSNNRPATIIATARQPSTALQQLSKTHPGLHIVTLDVSPSQGISSASEEVRSIVGDTGLNCLINNAAIGFSTNISTVTPESMMTMFQVNAVAPLFITKAFMPLLQAAAARSSGMGIHRAAVINMSSVLGSITLNCGDGAKYKNYAYGTSKAALNMVTRCLAADLKSSGILCMSLHPGWVKTDMGGPNAELTVEESVSGILSVLFSLSERDHGGFLDYRGQSLQW